MVEHDGTNIAVQGIGTALLGRQVSATGRWNEGDLSVEVDVNSEVADSSLESGRPGPPSGRLFTDTGHVEPRPGAIRDILALNRQGGNGLRIIVAREVAESEAWQNATVVVSKWTTRGLAEARDKLSVREEIIGLGQSQSANGDIKLIMETTHINSSLWDLLSSLEGDFAVWPLVRPIEWY